MKRLRADIQPFRMNGASMWTSITIPWPGKWNAWIPSMQKNLNCRDNSIMIWPSARMTVSLLFYLFTHFQGRWSACSSFKTIQPEKPRFLLKAGLMRIWAGRKMEKGYFIRDWTAANIPRWWTMCMHTILQPRKKPGLPIAGGQNIRFEVRDRSTFLM